MKKIKMIPSKEARRNFAELINEVHFTGKSIVITKSGKPMVILSSTKTL